MNFKQETKQCILISQVWFNKGRESFREMLELSVKYCRKQNPNAYIIVSGAGHLYPTKITEDICDKLIWQSELNEIIGNGFPMMIYKGLIHAKEMGFAKVFKFRGDSIILVNDICNYCEQILHEENKKILITQDSTKDGWMGDMVLFAETDLMIELFDFKKWHKSNSVSGNGALAKRYMDIFNVTDTNNWIETLKKNCSFRDVPKFKWVDLRYNYGSCASQLKNELDKKNESDYSQFYWGRHGEHFFDKDGNFVKSGYTVNTKNWLYEKDFYSEKQ
jgi:hypothetical protein